MDIPKVKMPSAQYIVNLLIAMLVIFAILRFAPIPDKYKAWFRV
jgi:hypothetical protein